MRNTHIILVEKPEGNQLGHPGEGGTILKWGKNVFVKTAMNLLVL
jgi:hypothetical protein